MPTKRKPQRRTNASARGGDRPGAHEKPARITPPPAHVRRRKPAGKRPTNPGTTDEMQFYDPERWDGLS